jgi:hypothetical protein
MYYLSSQTLATGNGRCGRVPKPLTLEAFEARLAEYCRKYDVALAPSGLPPYPAGQRETPQHRAWMGLHRAQKRLADRAGATAARVKAR